MTRRFLSRGSLQFASTVSEKERAGYLRLLENLRSSVLLKQRSEYDELLAITSAFGARAQRRLHLQQHV